MIVWMKRYSNISLEEIRSMSIPEVRNYCEFLSEIIRQENKA